MNVLHGRIARTTVALVAVLLCLAAPASAAPDDERLRSAASTYPGPAYSSGLLFPPTQTEGQSKLWFHADAWWALLVEPTTRTLRVHELMPDHSWRPTAAVINTDVLQTGDALRDGDDVHVVSRVGTSDLQYVRLTFDPETREYRADAPRLVTDRGGNAAPTIVEDSSGRLWVGYANGRFATVTYSDDGVTWAPTVDIARTGSGSFAEFGSLVAFDDRVGMLWSEQETGSFQFAYHRIGDDPEVWTREVALSGVAEADNHVSMVRIPGEPADTLVAAVKTSKGDQDEDADEALIKILVRNADGQWSEVPVSTVGDQLSDPLLQVDLSSRTLHLFASSSAGDIVEKQSSLDDLRFRRGLGDLFLLGAEGRVLDPTGTKEPVTAESGMVVLAHDAVRQTYRHAEAPVGEPAAAADPDDRTPPSRPGAAQGRAVSPDEVVLSWSPSTDGDRWVPAADGPPVARYAVYRNGMEVGSVTDTSFRDEPRTGPAAQGLTVEYEVRAIDEAGNRSDPTRIVVTLPPAPSRVPALIGLAVIGVAGLAAIYRLYRLRRNREALAAGAAPTAADDRIPAWSGTPER